MYKKIIFLFIIIFFIFFLYNIIIIIIINWRNAFNVFFLFEKNNNFLFDIYFRNIIITIMNIIVFCFRQYYYIGNIMLFRLFFWSLTNILKRINYNIFFSCIGYFKNRIFFIFYMIHIIFFLFFVSFCIKNKLKIFFINKLNHCIVIYKFSFFCCFRFFIIKDATAFNNRPLYQYLIFILWNRTCIGWNL